MYEKANQEKLDFIQKGLKDRKIFQIYRVAYSNTEVDKFITKKSYEQV